MPPRGGSHTKYLNVGVPFSQQAVMAAMVALNGKATTKQVKAYLRKHPHIYEGSEPSHMERSIQAIRMGKYCRLSGKNRDGEEVYVSPTEPNPKGVRRDRRGFYAKMNLAKARASCIGPLRANAGDAKKDYDQLQEWRAVMTLSSFRIFDFTISP